jgi:ATP-dependent Clp protease ATP-binding subunit ClpC
VPDDLLEAQEQFAQVRREKEAAINAEDFDQAAALRDKEQQLLRMLVERELEWRAGVDLAAVVQENQRLHREVEHLRELLRRHGIEPNGGTAETA